MKIVILVGGTSANGNPEHRYLVNAFLEQFGDQVTRIITCDPQPKPFMKRLKGALKRGNFKERFARKRYGGGYGPDSDLLAHALFGASPLPQMPGAEKTTVVSSHNNAECERLLEAEKPDIIVVYGTTILKPHIFTKPRLVTLNMHTGLSPHYRGDSTLFWPVFYDDPDHLGVTVHKLVADVDGGDIVRKRCQGRDRAVFKGGSGRDGRICRLPPSRSVHRTRVSLDTPNRRSRKDRARHIGPLGTPRIMKHNQPNNLIRQLLFGFGVLLYRIGLARVVIGLTPRRVRALLYHAVEPTTNDWTEGLGVNVTPEEFAANLDYFQTYYNVVDVMDLVSDEKLRRPLVITFDDGYQSVFDHAAPALVSRNMPATVYLISRAVNGELVWVNLLNRALHHAPEATRQVTASIPKLAAANTNREILRTVQEDFEPAAIELLCTKILEAVPLAELEPPTPLYMNRESIQSLQSQNIHFGFHTRDHYNMGLCSREDVVTQLDKSEVEEVLDSDSFAYPFGYFNEHAIQCVEADGYQRIMTVGNNNRRFCTHHLDRIEVFTDNPAHVFAHIEVVEPIISVVRRLVLTMKGRYNTRAPSSTSSTTPARTR